MILRFLRRRGGGDASGGPGEIAGRETYEGLEILARPVREGGQWRWRARCGAPATRPGRSTTSSGPTSWRIATSACACRCSRAAS
ncbi:MAG: hypothetical protein U5K43_12165 [Halofilum sp. (in: g-proteobacteria)]|nr:hypothetical protein [Halofilum sp. (in: g-proteobacteria)]